MSKEEKLLSTFVEIYKDAGIKTFVDDKYGELLKESITVVTYLSTEILQQIAKKLYANENLDDLEKSKLKRIDKLIEKLLGVVDEMKNEISDEVRIESNSRFTHIFSEWVDDFLKDEKDK